MRKKILFAVIVLFSSLATRVEAQVYLDDSQPIEKRVEDALNRMTLSEKIRMIHAQSKFSSAGCPRLGLPDFWMDDGPHGVRPNTLWDEWSDAGQTNDSCVAFPALTCLAATWDVDLSRSYGKALGEEALYRGKGMMLGPGLNMIRTPLNGRNFEYMGEDPYLTARMGVPYIQGLQSNGVGACAKHFALNNNEKNRYSTNVIVDDRTLHEIYLPAFEAAVKEGKTWGVMGAYNLYKDQFLCENQYLVRDILKGEWGFDGVVVSDWGATHHTMGAALNGLDMEFGSYTNGMTSNEANAYDRYYLAKPYQKLIEDGKLTTKELDDKVRRVLRLYFRTVMRRDRGFGSMCTPEHYAVARQIGDEGIVLLKNDKNLLPLNTKKIKSVLVVGENAIKKLTVGGGSSSLKAQHEFLPYDVLKKELTSLGVTVDYARGYTGENINCVIDGKPVNETRDELTLRREAADKAQKSDCVIFIGGLNKSRSQDGEGSDRRHYEQPYGQDSLILAIQKVNKNIVYVGISGNPYTMLWLDKVPAVLQAWFLGSEAGNSIADVLLGKVNPSGKLPYTWWTRLEDVPAHKLNAYPGKKNKQTKHVDEEYKEGIFIGYRGADKYHVKPLFAFGHGLSYTNFALSNLKIDKQSVSGDGKVKVSVTVTNKGKRAGAEVVQLYVHDDQCSVERPEKELKAFRKVSLNPGESKTVSMEINKHGLSFYDVNKHDWTTEPGTFTILVGDASDNLPLKAKLNYE